MELGCGSGAFITFVARTVGDEGKVFALDIQPEMLEQLKNKLKHPENRNIKNIVPFEWNTYDLPFEDNFFDLVYTITVLQEIQDKNRALKEVMRVLKPNGILAVTGFITDRLSP